MTQPVVAYACKWGARNAIELCEFIESLGNLPEPDRRLCCSAFVASFELPGDASLERSAIVKAIKRLAELAKNAAK